MYIWINVNMAEVDRFWDLHFAISLLLDVEGRPASGSSQNPCPCFKVSPFRVCLHCPAQSPKHALESPSPPIPIMSATTTTVPSSVINKPIVDALAAGNFKVSQLFSVQGKWAVVTGGRVGIGLMIAAGMF